MTLKISLQLISVKWRSFRQIPKLVLFSWLKVVVRHAQLLRSWKLGEKKTNKKTNWFESVLNGRRRLLTDSDARLMMSNMRKDKLLTPKEASKELNKTVGRWTARRALGRTWYVASVKKNKPALSGKNVRARL